MKRVLYKTLSVLLSLCVLLGLFPLSASAREVTADGHILNDPSLLKDYAFPDDWSRPALEFCVAAGIMEGKKPGDLAPKDNTTRAETAALIVRLLGAEAKGQDLSAYTDAVPGAWYTDELAAAVRAGIMNGTSGTTLSPNDPITREQACTLLSRAFGLYPQDPEAYLKFQDSKSVSGYARNAVSALSERGWLKGYEDNTLRPKARITRQELAQLLYQMFTAVCTEPEQLPSSGRVLYRGSAPIPEGWVLDGDLLLGCGLTEPVTLNNLTLTGTLTLRCGDAGEATLTGCSMKTLSVPCGLKVVCDSTPASLTAAGGADLAVSAEKAMAFGSCTLRGSYKEVTCLGADSTVTLDGPAESCLIQTDRSTLQGTGRAATVTIYGSGNKVTLPYGELIDRSDVYEYDHALEIVETVEIWDTVIRDTYLYQSSSLYGAFRKIPAGSLLRHKDLAPGASAAAVYATDGTFGWVPASAIRIPSENFTSEKTYSKAVLEGFVEQKGYSSSTSYLIWVSLKTQTVNIFQGSKGNWTLIRAYPCSTGKNATPTPQGTYYMDYHVWEWDFGSYKVRNVSGFYQGYAFHTRPHDPSYTRVTDPTLGAPASRGCIRMADADCSFIYNNIPFGTTIVIY